MSNSSNANLSPLYDFRTEQAKKLAIRLKVFRDTVLSKYGSYDKIKSDDCIPIQSENDVNLIKKLIELKNFVMIPISTEKGMTHAYTIGLWYYWGLPEIVLTFDEPVDSNPEFIHIIVNLIHDYLFSKYSDKLTSQSPDIDRETFSQSNSPKNLVIDLEDYNIQFKLSKVDETDYMSNGTSFMFWFYMYYMEAEHDDKNEPKLYPVYQINMGQAEYTQVTQKLISIMIEASIKKLAEQKISGGCETDSDISSIDTLSESDNGEYEQVQVETLEQTDKPFEVKVYKS